MASAGRIKRKFRELRARGEAALIPFIVAGDPDLDTTRRLVLELEARGADLIELGVPFSDPMADGPANQRALARGRGAGASLAAILSMVSELRAQTQIPIILFGYFNPIFHYGCERLCADAARAGIDGILTVDLQPEEAADLQRTARANGLDIISAPEQAAEVATMADAVVVGSAISLLIEAHIKSGDGREAVGGLVGAMKHA